MLAPNVVVAQFLASSGKMTAAQKEKLVANIQGGYQRELTYKHADGSYSVWGPSDPSGSTWLTAAAARVFSQASIFANIDNEIIKTAFDWLVDKQQTNGSFIEVGRVLEPYKQGGAAGGFPLTAFTLFGFLQSPLRDNYRSSIIRAVQHLENNIDTIKNDDYTTAICAYALVLAGSPRYSELIATLEKNANRTQPNKMFWDGANSTYKDGIKVEATGYALLAFLAANRTETAFAISSWLLTQQTSNGGFYSTPVSIVKPRSFFVEQSCLKL